MKKPTESIISNTPVCLVCGTPHHLCRHHIYSGRGRRELSEKYGLWVYLCGRHHTMGAFSIHHDSALDKKLREQGQRAWEARYGTREDFIRIFGRSWLED